MTNLTKNTRITNKGKRFPRKIYVVHENADPESPVIFVGQSKDISDKYSLPWWQINALVSEKTQKLPLINDTNFIEYYMFRRLDGKTKENIFKDKESEERILRLLKEKDIRESKKVENVEVTKIGKTEKKLKEIKFHLDLYGNTFTNKDPKKYVDALKSRFGYNVDVEYRPKRIVRRRNMTAEVFNPIYILTLISKPEEVTNE